MSLAKTVKQTIRSQFCYQLTDMSGVPLAYAFVDGTFFINSAVGLLKYSPRSDSDAQKFRNGALNEIEKIRASNSSNQRDLFRVYRLITSNFSRARWQRNLRTRLKELHVL